MKSWLFFNQLFVFYSKIICIFVKNIYMKHYLIDKNIYSNMKSLFDGMIFRQEFNDTHHKIKFFCKKFEKMFLNRLGEEKFNLIFVLHES